MLSTSPELLLVKLVGLKPRGPCCRRGACRCSPQNNMATALAKSKLVLLHLPLSLLNACIDPYASPSPLCNDTWESMGQSPMCPGTWAWLQASHADFADPQLHRPCNNPRSHPSAEASHYPGLGFIGSGSAAGSVEWRAAPVVAGTSGPPEPGRGSGSSPACTTSHLTILTRN